MTTTNLQGQSVPLTGDLPTKGSAAPEFSLAGTDLADFTGKEFDGQRIVLNIFPSIDTGVCQASVRKFNELAGDLDNTVVVNVSMDLPFAMKRFLGDENLDKVTGGSAFRSSFGEDYGVTMAEGPMRGLLARAVVVIAADGTVSYTQLVDEITNEPDYAAALDAIEG